MSHCITMQFPEWAESSEQYRELFNAVAAENGLGIKWNKEIENGSPNIPDPGEIEVNKENRDKYGITDNTPRKFNPLLAEDICNIRREIETRITEMNKAGLDFFPILKSGTYTHDKMSQINPAERAWLTAVKLPLFEASQDIYGIQSIPNYDKTKEWVLAHGDPFMKYSFTKAPDGKVYARDSAAFQNSQSFGTSVPWFPQRPTFSRMWPADMTEDELKFINSKYDEFDPIRLTYTVVRSVSKEYAMAHGSTNGILRKVDGRWVGRWVEWIREGLNGKMYHVRNMAFDPEMRPHFIKIAETLEKNADITVGGATLEPTFREYTLTMAKCFRTGNFEELLKADLDQFKGNLFLTIFPHEGYWKDGIKFPLMMDIGIRDASLLKTVEEEAYAFNWLGDRVTSAAGKAGLKDYKAPLFDVDETAKADVPFWPFITGGFMRAYKREPGGHDYPKRNYKDIKGHRVVALLDTLEAWAVLLDKVAKATFEDGAEDYCSFEGNAATAVSHEATHGVQIQPTDKTLSGAPLSDAFGIWWGVLVEPWADSGSLLVHNKLHEDGRIDDKKYKTLLYSDIVYQFVRMASRDEVLTDEMVAEGPHVVGSNMLAGWLYKKGAITYESGKIHINIDKVPEAAGEFFDELTVYAAKGDLEAFKTFVRDCVQALPKEIEDEIMAKKKDISPFVVLDRGELKLPAR